MVFGTNGLRDTGGFFGGVADPMTPEQKLQQANLAARSKGVVLDEVQEIIRQQVQSVVADSATGELLARDIRDALKRCGYGIMRL